MSQEIEGVIKFKFINSKIELEDCEELKLLVQSKRTLFDHNLVSNDENGIGFGNISHRKGNSQKFYITASQTGGIRELRTPHFSLIKEFNLENNQVTSQGVLPPSSETMSHSAIYSSFKEINTVIHIHQRDYWKKRNKKAMYTPENMDYGTPELAIFIQNLIKNNERHQGEIIMKGHQDGILFFGKDVKQLTKTILERVIG